MIAIAALAFFMWKAWRLSLENRTLKAESTFQREGNERLAETFKALSSDTLQANSQQFLELAAAKFEKYQVGVEKKGEAIDALLKPIEESLKKAESTHQEIRKTLTTTHVSLSEQVKGLAEAQCQLRNETTNLTRALRAPTARGRWGEIQLKRVVEMAGMVQHCDFVEQKTQGGLRPDMVVRLPGGKQIVVDSKAPLQAYLEALEADNEHQRLEKLQAHAKAVKNHITSLASKSYWEQFPDAPEFVVLFMPGETFFSAALELDPGLIEYGVEKRVIVATPTTLIALLRSVAYGWRHESLAENAQLISQIGKELYERIGVLAGHFGDVKKGLERSVDAYNKSVASFETRVMVSARKLHDAGVSGEEMPKILEPIEKRTR